MKAIKRPVPIDVEEFQPGEKPWPLGVEEGPKGQYFINNALHNSRINLKPGDYVNVTNAGDVYPIAREVFESTYDLVQV